MGESSMTGRPQDLSVPRATAAAPEDTRQQSRVMPSSASKISGEQICPDSVGNRTTVMLRNLPNRYTAAMVLALLDAEGFAGLYDFFYLPVDLKSDVCFGYAFI